MLQGIRNTLLLIQNTSEIRYFYVLCRYNYTCIISHYKCLHNNTVYVHVINTCKGSFVAKAFTALVDTSDAGIPDGLELHR